ncbi:MAG TPA: N,N-dimethylformamidase beta subunit family domain-containing protein [Gaiellaceae bacterium]|nr:N,N-dimethylformamidase beta subunit family domain-containing protein [Gaiellaceae bacterium]
MKRLVLAAAALALVATPAAAAPKPSPLRPSFTAVFTQTSYAPGALATLRVKTPVRRLDLQILRAGAERGWSSVGRPWGPVKHIRFRHAGENTVHVRLGAWSSGLYFARLTLRSPKRAEFAPFVLRPDVWGRSRVAIVLPTYSWQAYNFYDANGDGKGDSWYVDPAHRHSVLLGRPFAYDGKPPHYRTQQRGFLRFLVHNGHQADYLTDEDLEQVASGDDLAQRYDLIVISGHEEYVTTHIYDVIQRYRDLGGNLAFLSADNFFWRVDLKDGKIWRVNLWRNLGRPEAALIGVQYRGNDRGGHTAPYVVANTDAAPWLFSGLDVGVGATLGTARYGIEFDGTSPDSPPGTAVLAQVDPGLKGGAIVGQMTYYEQGGAKVFAAGTLSFGGSDNAVGTTLFNNIWNHLVVP